MRVEELLRDHDAPGWVGVGVRAGVRARARVEALLRRDDDAPGWVRGWG